MRTQRQETHQLENVHSRHENSNSLLLSDERDVLMCSAFWFELSWKKGDFTYFLDQSAVSNILNSLNSCDLEQLLSSLLLLQFECLL